MNDEYLIEKEEYKGYVIKLIQDESPQNPQTEWDNLGTMVCWHKRYDLGDKHNIRHEDFAGWDDIEAHLIKEYDACVVLPLYLYDHSGITMRTYSFNDRWDSGQVGFIYISKEKVRKEYSVKHITKTLIEKITKYLESEVSTYDDYLTGNVCGFSVEDEEGDVVDSCWGFYGDDGRKEAMSNAKNVIDHLHERWVEKLIDAKVIEIKEEEVKV